ncbi:MAG: hypothetical protein ABWY02_16595 [Telluria sp.]
MNTILRSLIVWLVLLAVPFQGFASAAMLACGPGHAAPAGLAPDVHHGMHDGVHNAAPDMSGHDHAAMTHNMMHDSPGEHGAPGHGNGHTCSACSACSIGAAIAPTVLPALAAHAPPLPSVAVADRHPPSVHLALPERPPRPLLA